MSCMKEVLVVILLVTFVFSTIIIPNDSTKDNTEDYIYGGYLASAGQFPHQASLRVKYSNSNVFRHTCGGSIITNRFILSAAHCFPAAYHNASANYIVVLGAHNKTGDGIEYGVERIFVHPGWDASEIIHDVGLAQTNRDIVFTPIISPIPVSRNFINSSYRAVTSGWGRTNVIDLHFQNDCSNTCLYLMTNNMHMILGRSEYIKICIPVYTDKRGMSHENKSPGSTCF